MGRATTIGQVGVQMTKWSRRFQPLTSSVSNIPANFGWGGMVLAYGSGRVPDKTTIITCPPFPHPVLQNRASRPACVIGAGIEYRLSTILL